MLVEQVYIFLSSVLIGGIMGVIFDFFRALRRNGNTKNIIVYIQDIVFWLIIAVIIITSSFILNNGDLRGYMLVGYIIGALLYMLILSKYIKGLFIIIMNFFEKIFKTLVKPFEKILEKLERKNKILENKQES